MTFIVNGSQAVGARPLDVRAASVDAVISVGFKWLCGPYGTGFCWMRRELREASSPANIEEIASYDQALVSYLLERIDRGKYRILSLEEGPARSTLVLFSHRDSEKNTALPRHLQENRIHVAMRAGAVRVSPHLYNTQADIDRLLDVLNRIY